MNSVNRITKWHSAHNRKQDPHTQTFLYKDSPKYFSEHLLSHRCVFTPSHPNSLSFGTAVDISFLLQIVPATDFVARRQTATLSASAQQKSEPPRGQDFLKLLCLDVPSDQHNELLDEGEYESSSADDSLDLSALDQETKKSTSRFRHHSTVATAMDLPEDEELDTPAFVDADKSVADLAASDTEERGSSEEDILLAQFDQVYEKAKVDAKIDLWHSSRTYKNEDLQKFKRTNSLAQRNSRRMSQKAPSIILDVRKSASQTTSVDQAAQDGALRRFVSAAPRHHMLNPIEDYGDLEMRKEDCLL